MIRSRNRKGKKAGKQEKILVKGLNGRNNRKVEETVRTINVRLGINMRIRNTRSSHEGLVINLNSIGEKIMKMRKKYILRGAPAVMADMLTWRVRTVQSWIESFADELKEDGQLIQTGYIKVKPRGYSV